MCVREVVNKPNLGLPGAARRPSKAFPLTASRRQRGDRRNKPVELLFESEEAGVVVLRRRRGAVTSERGEPTGAFELAGGEPHDLLTVVTIGAIVLPSEGDIWRGPRRSRLLAMATRWVSTRWLNDHDESEVAKDTETCCLVARNSPSQVSIHQQSETRSKSVLLAPSLIPSPWRVK